MSEEDGARLFASLRTLDVPASGGVSVERAIRTGKRTKALRVAAAGVFVLIAMGLLPLVLRPSAAPPVAAGTFDPLVRTISAGKAAGFHPLTYITGRESQMVLMSPDSKGYESAHAVVYVGARARAPDGTRRPHSSRAPPGARAAPECPWLACLVRPPSAPLPAPRLP